MVNCSLQSMTFGHSYRRALLDGLRLLCISFAVSAASFNYVASLDCPVGHYPTHRCCLACRASADPLPLPPHTPTATNSTQAELKVGDKLSDFAEYYKVLKASDGKTVSLASFKGKKPVVLFFYPKGKSARVSERGEAGGRGRTQ